MTRALLFGTVVFGALAGCASKRLPPGTPPPEYETRTFPPWPPLSAAPSASVAAPVLAPSATAAPAASEGPLPAKTPPSPSPSAAGE